MVIVENESKKEETSLRYMIPDDPNQPYDMLAIISKVVDNGNFFQIMPDYAKNIGFVVVFYFLFSYV
jgi:propionyl-CoA carboxylase beta chain